MKRATAFITIATAFLLADPWPASAQEVVDYVRDLRPLLSSKCFKCHNTSVEKGGVNLDNYKENERVIADGQLWLKVLDEIKTRQMPPKSEAPLSVEVYDKLVSGINQVLQSSLRHRNPGHVVIRRLSHAEYRYTIQDLVGVDFDAKSYFPSDGSGGGGFDNQGGVLFFTPLKLERYYDAADSIVSRVRSEEALWKNVVQEEYDPGWWRRFSTWVRSLFSEKPVHAEEEVAENVIYPFASRAFRRFLKDDEKASLMKTFRTVYDQSESKHNPERFDDAVAEVLKATLISPHFLYRAEEEPERADSYQINNFELASRLSYFLWSSMPDDELFKLAYAGKLQDTLVLQQQVVRMLHDGKAKRFAETFVTQWLGITKLVDTQPMADPTKYPSFDASIRQNLYKETVEYFYYVLTGSRNLMDLVSSNYAFLNADLARYYSIDNVTGDSLKRWILTDSIRGGILGMGSVLSATSTPVRTSPVLRGKWVMEQLLGISPPPPPPEVGKLPEGEEVQGELGLRRLLEIHRSKPACEGCHRKMDPLGLGLENFDAIGRWRTSYGKASVDASGVLADGRRFNGPVELKQLLMSEREKIARNLSMRVLSYALGRSVLFTDEPAIEHLESCLLNNNFDPQLFLIEVVKSYPFRMKVNDFEKKVNEI